MTALLLKPFSFSLGGTENDWYCHAPQYSRSYVDQDGKAISQRPTKPLALLGNPKECAYLWDEKATSLLGHRPRWRIDIGVGTATGDDEDEVVIAYVDIIQLKGVPKSSKQQKMLCTCADSVQTDIVLRTHAGP